MKARGLSETSDSPHLAARAALMTRASKRDVDGGELPRTRECQVGGEVTFDLLPFPGPARLRVFRIRP